MPHRRAELLLPVGAGRGGGAMMFGVPSPTPEEFAALDRAGGSGAMVPVTRKLLADSETAVGVYRKLAGNRPGTVLLGSAEQGKRWARYSFVGVRSAGVLTERDGVTQWLGEDLPGLTDDLPADPLAAVRPPRRPPRPPAPPPPPRPPPRPPAAPAPDRGPAAADGGARRLPGVRRRPPPRAVAADEHRRPRDARAGDDAGDRSRGAGPHRRVDPADRQRVTWW